MDKSPTPEDYRRAGLQAARRRALLMIVLLTLLAATIIAAAAWLISGYEPPSTAADGRGAQGAEHVRQLGDRATAAPRTASTAAPTRHHGTPHR